MWAPHVDATDLAGPRHPAPQYIENASGDSLAIDLQPGWMIE
jgi:hypothetical protein